MKCDKRNSKLEQFEATVDGVMDWINDAEVFVSSAVEGTYEVVKERTDRLEVNETGTRFSKDAITYGTRRLIRTEWCYVPK